MTPNFGNKTIVYAANLMAHMETDNGIRMFLYAHGLDGQYDAALGNSKRSRVFYMFRSIRESTDEDAKRRMAEALSEFLPRAYQHLSRFAGEEVVGGPASVREFLAVLRAEGWDIQQGNLVAHPSTSVSLAAHKGKLESMLESFGFKVAIGHLNQAVDNIAHGNWAAANGQTRTFLEATFDEMAARKWTGTGTPPTAGQARQYLENVGLIDPQLDGPLLKDLFQILHTEGSHPGLSDQEDSENRLLMAVAIAGRYLARL
jgi:hypothetical protein